MTRAITISKEQTDLIKGIGILLIVLHNFFHLVPPNTGENEFQFGLQVARNFYHHLKYNYLEIVNVLFSLLGHYGVQLFIFISGYGLAKSYQNNQLSFFSFIKKRVYTIYPSFILSIFILIIYNYIIYSKLPNLDWSKQIAYKLLMVNTLIPGEVLSVNGPWWFYALIMQLYILFIPIFHFTKRFLWKGFIFMLPCYYIIIYILYGTLLEYSRFVFANAIGHIPEFMLGITLALDLKFKIKPWHLILTFLIFILGNFSIYIFSFTFVCVTYILIVSIIYLFKKDILINKILKFYGKVSMYLFAVHGFFRLPFFVNFARTNSNPIKTIFTALLYLVSVTIVAIICREIILFLKKSIKNKEYVS